MGDLAFALLIIVAQVGMQGAFLVDCSCLDDPPKGRFHLGAFFYQCDDEERKPKVERVDPHGDWTPLKLDITGAIRCDLFRLKAEEVEQTDE